MEKKSPTAASLPRSGPQPLDLDASSPGDALALQPGDLLEDGSGFGGVISIYGLTSIGCVKHQATKVSPKIQ